MKGLKNKRIVLAALLLVLPQASWAGGYHYTHKAGVSRAEWDADRKLCVDAAKEVRKHPSAPTPYNPAAQATVAGAAGTAFGAGLMQGIMRRKAVYATYYNCLKAHGYVQRELSKDEFKEIRALKGQANEDRSYELGSALNPSHPIMPEDNYD